MHNPRRLELYEKLYFHELDRRDKIASRLSTPLGALIGAIGIVAFLLNSNSKIPSEVLRSAFWLIIVAAIVTLLVGGWYFRKAWFGHTDRHVATAEQIDDYHSKLEQQYRDQPDAASLVESHFEQYLLDTYRRSATTNAINNDQRSSALYRAGCWLTSAVVLALLSTIPFYVGKDSGHDRKEAVTSSSAPAATRASGQERRP